MIFLTGHHNAGKSTLAAWFKSIGFLHVETGDIVRGCYKSTCATKLFGEWAHEINSVNPDYFNELILKHIQEAYHSFFNADKVIITGNRQLGGINYLIRHIQEGECKHSIIFLEVLEEELYRRQIERKDRIIRDLTFNKFINEYLAYDKNMGIDNIKKGADYIINGNRDTDDIIKDASFI